MPRRARRGSSLIFSGEKLDGKNDEAKNEDQQADPVDAVHVSYEISFWPVRIRLTDIQIFRYLFDHAHGSKLGNGSGC